MARKHLKRLFAPKDWMLSKLTGVFAPRPRAGAHKIRECMPLAVILRNRLKYALNYKETQMIVRQGLVKVDGRARIDAKYPAGFMDVLEIPKTNDRIRMLYDVKGRFEMVRLSEEEAKIKLCKVVNLWTTSHRTPMLTTHDGRRIRFPDPKINRNDTIIIDVATGAIQSTLKARIGAIAMITGGSNRGLVGEILSVERHPGSFDIARLRDKQGNEFATRNNNVFVIANSFDSIPITMPRAQGQRINKIEEREQKLIAAEERKINKGNKKSKKSKKH